MVSHGCHFPYKGILNCPPCWVGWGFFHASSTHLTPSQPWRLYPGETQFIRSQIKVKGEKGEQENSDCLEEPETEYFLYLLFCFTWYRNQRLNTSLCAFLFYMIREPETEYFMCFSVLHDIGTRDWILPWCTFLVYMIWEPETEYFLYVLFCFTWYGSWPYTVMFGVFVRSERGPGDVWGIGTDCAACAWTSGGQERPQRAQLGAGILHSVLLHSATPGTAAPMLVLIVSFIFAGMWYLVCWLLFLLFFFLIVSLFPSVLSFYATGITVAFSALSFFHLFFYRFGMLHKLMVNQWIGWFVCIID